MRAKKALNNTIFGLMYEVVAIICSFIAPRLILNTFGSEYNGLTGSIRQFLNVVTLFQAGIGGVTIAALYKPLAYRDTHNISVVVKTAKSFFMKVSVIFTCIVLIVACGYPFLVKDNFDWFFVASLVIIMSLSTFVQYFFGQTYKFVLQADQNQRLIYMVDSAKVILNTALTVILVKLNVEFRLVTLASTSVFICGSIFIYLYTKNKYKIINNVPKSDTVLEQRWDNFGQDIAHFITSNTDLIVLSICAGLGASAVYVVYSLVFRGVVSFFNTFAKGVDSAFGNMLAKNEKKLIEKNFRLYEQMVFTIVTFLFGVTAVMIIPFIELYTSKAEDAGNYVNFPFAYIMIASTMMSCFRIPYRGIINAAGHFRQTRNPAFIEAGINIVVSVICTLLFGLSGVAIGSLCAYTFRAVRMAMYMSNTLIPRSVLLFFKRLVISFSIVVSTVLITFFLPMPKALNYMGWIVNAAIVSVIVLVLIISSELLFYKKDIVDFLMLSRGLFKKRKMNTKNGNESA